MRAALYCRYSSDRQRETSIADQVRVCAGFAEREGLQIVARHSDEEVSGSTPVAARRGGSALLADAIADRFEVLILEGLDRLSRDLVEQETIVRRLEHRGIRIVGVSDGYDSEAAGRKLHRGMRGLINEIYLDDLRHKTHRGQSGQFSRGYSAGGGGYGYRSVHDGHGYRVEIDPEQAEWVRWIYERRAEGWSIRQITFELNRLKVPSPRGKTWAVSGIYGSPDKGTGVLNNALYVGRYVWNRSQWVKDPDTGRRQRIERPESEWQTEQREDLRIVSDELAARVRARQDAPAAFGRTEKRGRPARSLLGGLMVCGFCGGAVVAVNQRLYGCSVRTDRGTSVCCGVFAPREIADTRILAKVRDEMLSPAVTRSIEKRLAVLIGEIEGTSEHDRREAKARIQEVEQEISRLVDAIAAVGISDALRTRLAAAERERDELLRTTATAWPARMHIPDIVKQYKVRVMSLRDALCGDVLRAREALREMLQPIRIIENAEGVFAEVDSDPAIMLKHAAGLVYKSGSGGQIFFNRQLIQLRGPKKGDER